MGRVARVVNKTVGGVLREAIRGDSREDIQVFVMKRMSRSWSVMREITEGILLRRERSLIRAALREVRWGGG